MILRGGTHAHIAASHYHDCVGSKDGPRKLRSSIAVPSYVGCSGERSAFPLLHRSMVMFHAGDFRDSNHDAACWLMLSSGKN